MNHARIHGMLAIETLFKIYLFLQHLYFFLSFNLYHLECVILAVVCEALLIPFYCGCECLWHNAYCV